MPDRLLLLAGLFLGLLAAGRADAQSPVPGRGMGPRFVNITTEDGLSQGSVLSIAQDRHGYMWFGTQQGLNRYDGHRFTLYPGEEHHLAAGDFGTLLVDRDGMIWIGYSNSAGLDRFDPVSGNATHFRHNRADSGSLSNDGVRSLHEDRRGTIWVGTRLGGLNRFDPNTGTFTRFFPAGKEPGDDERIASDDVYSIGTVRRSQQGPDFSEIWSIADDTSGGIWVGLGTGLYHLDESGVVDRYQPAPGDDAATGSNWVSALHYDRDGTLWVGGWGLFRFDPETAAFDRYLLDPTASDAALFGANRIQSIVEDRTGNLWVGTAGGGLGRFDKTSGTFTRFRHTRGDPNSLRHDDVLSLFEDRQGILWIGTPIGLSRLDLSVQPLTRYRFDPSDPNGLQGRSGGDAAAGVHLDRDDVLWVGTLDGGVLNRFDRRRGTVTHYRHDPADPASAPPGHLMSIYRDREGRLWIGSRGSEGGVSWLDETTGRFTHYMHDPEDSTGIGGNVVSAILEDHRGALWLGTYGGGLNRFIPEDETFASYRFDERDSTSIGSNLVTALYEDRSGRFWVGTNGGGLNLFDTQTGRFERPSHHPALRRGAVTGMYERTLEPGVLWVTTTCCGLFRFDVPSGSATHHYNRFNSELPLNRLWSVLGDRHGMLWMSADVALIRFDPEQERFDVFWNEDGHEFNNNVYHEGYNGELFFGGTGGITSVRPDGSYRNPHPPEVLLTGLRLFDEPILPGPDSPLKAHVADAQALEFSHAQNDLTLEYLGVHYRNPARNQYAYMLEGYDDAWRYVGTERRAVYTNLSPGDYVFRVKASNSDGVWNETGRALAITVRPPWWQTSWAILVYFVLVIGGGISVDRLQRRRIVRRERERFLERELEQTRTIEAMNEQLEAQNRELLKLDEVKSRFFTDISHEFRTPLTLILGPLKDLLSDSSEPVDAERRFQFALMQRNALRLLRLINQLLDLSRLESGRLVLRARRTNLVPLVRATAMAFASLSRRKHITLEVDVAQGELYPYLEPDKIEKVLYNLLSNAFKFTPENGTVTVRVEEGQNEAGGYVELHVQDTGEGIPSESVPFIFDRYVSASRHLDRVGAFSVNERQGAGIGLALTKELVTLHGGTIAVKSTADTGSTFTVRLPKGRAHLRDEDIVEARDSGSAHPDGSTVESFGIDATDDYSTAGGQTTSEGSQLPGGPPEDAPLILVVEDSVDVRAYLRSHLRSEYRIAEAGDGESGLRQAIALRPSLVISDVMMPRMDGYALCRAIKTDDRLSDIPVVLLTARADNESRVTGLETGADDYLNKPFDSEELTIRVENLIEIRRQLRARYSRSVVVEPAGIEITPEDAAFLARVQGVVEDRMASSTFGVELLAEQVGLSRRQLDRRLKALTKLSASGFVRKLQLERAAQLLGQGYGNVSEVADAVGFGSPRTFSKLFHQTMGMYPSEYAKRED